jgi:hypothetical protein
MSSVSLLLLDMTRKDFLNELRTTQNTFTWFVRADGAIRAKLSTANDTRIFNPITAVTFARTGEFFSEDNWSKPADLIGISIEDCAYLLSSCNYDWEPSSVQGLARHEILEFIPITAKWDQAEPLPGRVKGYGRRFKSWLARLEDLIRFSTTPR